jgi:hypothetical protein
MGLGQERGADPEENCVSIPAPRIERVYPKANGLNVEITDLTPTQKLSVQCPTCAATPRERCCEISNGVFRQDPHFGRLLLAAGQGASSPQHKPATNMLPDFSLR